MPENPLIILRGFSLSVKVILLKIKKENPPVIHMIKNRR